MNKISVQTLIKYEQKQTTNERKYIYMPIIQVALVTYLISAGIMGIYFNWLYAVEHGFLAWFFFGEIIASLKGLVWPFFIYF